PQAQKYVEQYPAFNVPAPVLTRLQSNPSPANPAFAEACRILGPKCVEELTKVQQAPPSVISFMEKHGPAVLDAKDRTAGQWKNWFWVCFGGMILFLFTIPTLRGRWNPRKARADQAAHESAVQEELAGLAG
ncbi:MAG: hypothetical protein J2P57_12675, partial [Acidimicrobiaceae bacterium]|nr:hypothetical protein [Acidimicrobiaceae bacterium]